MDVKLILQQGDARLRTIPLRLPEVVIGRRKGCAVRIVAEDISRQHCCIRSKEGQVSVKDLGSANGTFVNGQLISGEQPLNPGDQLKIGSLTFVVEFHPNGKSPPLPTDDAEATEIFPEQLLDEPAPVSAPPPPSPADARPSFPGKGRNSPKPAPSPEAAMPRAEIIEELPMAEVEEELPMAEVEEDIPTAFVDEDAVSLEPEIESKPVVPPRKNAAGKGRSTVGQPARTKTEIETISHSRENQATQPVNEAEVEQTLVDSGTRAFSVVKKRKKGKKTFGQKVQSVLYYMFLYVFRVTARAVVKRLVGGEK